MDFEKICRQEKPKYFVQYAIKLTFDNYLKLAKHLQFLKQIFEIFCKASQSKLVDSWNDSICFDGSH